jgi:hypothetical protein
MKKEITAVSRIAITLIFQVSKNRRISATAIPATSAGPAGLGILGLSAL